MITPEQKKQKQAEMETAAVQALNDLHNAIQLSKSRNCFENDPDCNFVNPKASFQAATAAIQQLLTEGRAVHSTQHTDIVTRYNALIRYVMDEPYEDTKPLPLFKTETPHSLLKDFLILETTKERQKFVETTLFGKEPFSYEGQPRSF